MIDRGFIKWQPFNSLISPKTILNNLNKELTPKPTLFPEQIQNLNEEIINAYYSKSTIKLTIYEHNQLINLTTTIKEIYPNFNTLKLQNNKIISFNEIINLTY